MTLPQRFFLSWLLLTNLAAFLLFALDRARAARLGKTRIGEFHLAAAGALGGWLGGLAAMLLLRHKTAKLSFKVKYAAALLVWAGGLYTAARWLV